ncbi:MAG: hypothetical protein KAJ14_12165 [Candidatus Omnitrophica bacterium]|nr:hypothetical protein [Candidatus Omnitrophota bacterium]
MNWLLNLKVKIIVGLIKSMSLNDMCEKEEDFGEISKKIKNNLATVRWMKKP